MSDMEYFIGFDVGTGSGRACLVDRNGNLIAEHAEPTLTHRSPTDARIFEQSTRNIWKSLSICSKRVLAESGVKPEQVKGLGFDATCSLAVVDKQGKPMSVSRTGQSEEDEKDANIGLEGEWNVILWADHRAEEEAEKINSTGEGVLGFVGKTMSLEMEIPKTLWLSKHMAHERFKQCMFFDLPDFLTYHATSDLARSTCSLACKCSFVPIGATMTHDCDGGKEETSTQGWSARFFEKIGLHDLVEEDFASLGGIPGKNGLVLTAGQPVGKGLSKPAAEDLGLLEGTAVGSGVIDAYAGWIGTVAAAAGEDQAQPTLEDASARLAAIAGTSTCHIAQSKDGILVPGVWGPYRDAVFPNLWMNEGGQSSTGQLIDFMMQSHPAYPKLLELSKSSGKSTFELLAERLETLQREKGAKTLTHLTKDLHFYPDLHGNRSPLADPRMKGMITGLVLDDSLNDLAAKFNVTLEAIALQTRHIVDEMNAKGHKIDSIYMSGSQAKNGPLMRLLATVLQMPVIIPPQPSAAVVLGAAMLGRYAYDLTTERHGKPISSQQEAEEAKEKDGWRLWDVMVQMTRPGKRIEPRNDKFGASEKRLLDVKYKIFREAVEVQRKWRQMIADEVKDEE
ncbi:ribitol kinase [Cryptococcus bacillisporus CA1873]|uniref:Ribitol kinase n=1 Tax=Cryptococcus bacillisporus CA1873 TaxID=1296111 RepID=A0ABR5BI65_CRYGA|nr:ribitol kinase [Cryptococcus bacillisporus CA1873]|eukprot:KIR68834.1 ribitol kinase [Cryptococcus gattii CA1873]